MNSRAYCAGMAMATPFAAATLPYPWFLLSLIVAMPFVVHLVLEGMQFAKIGSVPAAGWLILMVCLLHLFGLWRGKTPYHVRVLVDTGVVAACVVVFLLGRTQENVPQNMLQGFFSALIPFTVVMAGLGLIKAALLEGGYLIGGLHALYPDQYPPGASLRGDYNLFGLSMMISSLGLVSWLIHHGSRGRDLAVGSLALALVLAAGILAGSRRSLLVSFLIPVMWFTIGIQVFSARHLVRKVILPMTVVICAVGLLAGNWLVNVPVPLHKYKILHLFPGSNGNTVQGPSEKRSLAAEERAPVPAEPSKDVNKQIDDQAELAPAGQPAVRTGERPAGKGVEAHTEADKTGTVMPVHPADMLGTLQKDQVYGLDSRIDRWRLAHHLLSQGAWLKGMGFAYHEIFSCRFAGCSFLDYPHFPILSEWLVSGIAGVLTALAVYLLLLQSLWRAGRQGWLSGSSVIALAVLPYSLLSGDTLFSIPQFIVVCLLAQSQAETGSFPDGKEPAS